MARYVRVSSLSLPGIPGSGREGVHKRVETAVRQIDQAAADQPDVLVLPEVFNALGASRDEWEKIAEPLDGPTVTALADRARRHHAYIVCPLFVKVEGGLRNASVLIDRQGEVAGAYYKIHPTLGEIERGVIPGTEATVLETDFGKCGFAICYDLNFRDVVDGSVANGAEIVFFSSMYRGGLQLAIWAFDFGIHLVSATPGENSRFVNPVGRMLAESSAYCRLVTRTLNLDCAVLHLDENHLKLEALKKKYGKSVELEILSPEAVFLLTCRHRNRSVQDLIAEFDLETRTDYFARANRGRQQALRRFARRRQR